MEDEFLDQNEEDDEDEKFRNRQTLSVPKDESSFNERSEDEEDSSPKIVIQPAEAEGEPPKKQETFKFNQNEMQETLKLI